MSSSNNPPQKKELITYRGVQVAKEWPEIIREAQRQKYYVIDGKPHRRVRYGYEGDLSDVGTDPCPDCTVFPGEYHVVGCDDEVCPVCREQAMGCECHYEGDDEP